MSLIQLQQQAITRLHEPRTSEKRAAKHRRAVRHWFIATLAKRGYTDAAATQAWNDAFDLWKLEHNAEE